MSDEEKYPTADWQYEVANGDTRLGYAEWVEHKVESGGPDLTDEVTRLCQDHPRTTAETLLRIAASLGSTDSWSGATMLQYIGEVIDHSGLFPAKVGDENGIGHWVGIDQQFKEQRA